MNRLLNDKAHADGSSEMYRHVAAVHEVGDEREVRHRSDLKFEAGPPHQVSDVRGGSCREVVECDDLRSTSERALCEMRADESCAAGDQNAHLRSPVVVAFAALAVTPRGDLLDEREVLRHYGCLTPVFLHCCAAPLSQAGTHLGQLRKRAERRPQLFSVLEEQPSSRLLDDLGEWPDPACDDWRSVAECLDEDDPKGLEAHRRDHKGNGVLVVGRQRVLGHQAEESDARHSRGPCMEGRSVVTVAGDEEVWSLGSFE